MFINKKTAAKLHSRRIAAVFFVLPKQFLNRDEIIKTGTHRATIAIHNDNIYGSIINVGVSNNRALQKTKNNSRAY